jgi:hypothetical protein
MNVNKLSHEQPGGYIKREDWQFHHEQERMTERWMSCDVSKRNMLSRQRAPQPK